MNASTVRRVPKMQWGIALLALVVSGCRTETPMPTVTEVDLQRYQGNWYVIAAIPSYLERNAYNAMESYSWGADGRMRTTFRYRNGSFTAPVKSMHPVGTVRPGTGQAIWGMQFIWPIQAEYRVVYLDSNYQTVIVGRSKRDYVWIMARTPDLPLAVYERLVERVARLGYDVGKLRTVPQRWPES